MIFRVLLSMATGHCRAWHVSSAINGNSFQNNPNKLCHPFPAIGGPLVELLGQLWELFCGSRNQTGSGRTVLASNLLKTC